VFASQVGKKNGSRWTNRLQDPVLGCGNIIRDIDLDHACQDRNSWSGIGASHNRETDLQCSRSERNQRTTPKYGRTFFAYICAVGSCANGNYTPRDGLKVRERTKQKKAKKGTQRTRRRIPQCRQKGSAAEAETAVGGKRQLLCAAVGNASPVCDPIFGTGTPLPTVLTYPVNSTSLQKSKKCVVM
jgi:hypothetical protein